MLANGGYTVHPVPAPSSTHELNRRSTSAGGKSQKLMLFNRGKAISGAPIISGSIQLPNPPIIIGITMKKIIRNACAVTTTFHSCPFPQKMLFPGCESSSRIRAEKTTPMIPEKAPNSK